MQSDPLWVESHNNEYFNFMLLRTPLLLCFPSLVHHIISRKEAFDDVPTVSLLESRAKWKKGKAAHSDKDLPPCGLGRRPFMTALTLLSQDSGGRVSPDPFTSDFYAPGDMSGIVTSPAC